MLISTAGVSGIDHTTVLPQCHTLDTVILRDA